MKKLGISAFVGMGQTSEQNIEYLKLAKSLGYEKLFTSLHIPEADYHDFLPACEKMIDVAVGLGIEVTADVSPHFWTRLGLEPCDLRSLGITSLRVDFGFDPLKTRELAQVSRCCIEVNASVMTEKDLNKLLLAGINCSNLRAGHNYYPRPETGLSFDLFMRRSEIFTAKGIPVSAFIPCMQHPRGPICSGLPTLESHRTLTARDAARQLWASGEVETLLFGDPLVPEMELAAVAQLTEEFAGPLKLRVKVDALPNSCKPIVWAPVHTNRLDAAAYVVRSQESRVLCLSPIMPQQFSQQRRRGDVTIDNANYGRYMGELQIVLQALPEDERVNVVGRIIDEDMCLLDCLTPGRSFCFEEVADR